MTKRLPAALVALGIVVALLATVPAATAQSFRDDGVTPLMRAVRDGETDAQRDLLKASVSVTAQDPFGWTVLHFAAIRGDVKVAKLLVAKGADLNPADVDGTTPLMLAAGGGRDNVVRYLVEAGVDVSARDNDGRAAVDHAVISNQKKVVKLLTRAGFPAPLPSSVPRQKMDGQDPSKPRPLNFPEVHYTELARQRHVVGEAVIKVWVGADGAITRTRILIGLPCGLSAQALDAVLRMRFEPVLKDGKPIESTATVAVKFQIAPP